VEKTPEEIRQMVKREMEKLASGEKNNAPVKQEERPPEKDSDSNGATIKLLPEDRRWYENLIMKEQIVRDDAQKKLLSIAKDAELMMKAMSEREGVDMKSYDIDWQTLTAAPKDVAAPKDKAT
jgi:hypothetical protein